MKDIPAPVITSIDEWRSVVADTFAPLDIDSPHDLFSGSLRTRALTEASTVSLITHTQSTVQRTARGIEMHDDDSLFLSINRADPFTVTQMGRAVSLPSGTACFTVSSHPYDLIGHGRLEQIVVKIPGDALELPRAARLDLVVRPFDVAREGLGLLRTFAESILLADADLEALSSDILHRTLLDLCMLAVQGLSGAEAAGTMDRSSLYQAMMTYIRSNAHDAALSPQSIAEQFHVSRRLVFQLFEEHASSPAAAIRTERLRRASFLLRNSDASINRIARQAGFTDLSTFARVFHRQYQALPSEWRRPTGD